MPDRYDVGYGRPPKHSRFKKGQSGNPRGRPRRARNVRTDLAEELRSRVVVRENGRAMRITKQRAMVKRLAEKALQGDVKAIGKALELIDRWLIAQEEYRPPPPISAEEQAVLDSLAQRFAADPDKSNEVSGMSGDGVPAPGREDGTPS